MALCANIRLMGLRGQVIFGLIRVALNAYLPPLPYLRLIYMRWQYFKFTVAVYVVFGAAGAVGGELVSRLTQQEGAVIIASDRDQSDLEKVKSATEFLPADAQDEAAVRLSILVGACLIMHIGMQ